MPVSNPKETIDPRILRLIGLDDVFDLDYDTYLTLLKEAMVKGRMTTTTIPTEEVMLLTEEYKRVKSKKDQGRFEVQKKKISTSSFSVGNLKGLIAPTKQGGIVPASAISKSPTINKVEEDIAAIAKSMNSIVEILSGQKKLNEDAAAYEKRKAEQDKRALAESKLEKRFEALKKATEKILAPVKSILSKIIDFLTTVFLGRVVYKLIEWFGDPSNKEKIQSIIRFLGDHWPKLLSLYILFGTSLGKFARGLVGVAVKGSIKLALAIAKLLAAKKVKGARGVAKFLGGGKGKLLGAGLTAIGTAGLAYAGTKALEGGEDKTQGFSGGGYVMPRFPAFSGGGFNFKNMMGGMFGFERSSNETNGYVSGEKGVDKVPAMLSDGEFVMSRGAVQKYGVDTLESMNAAGGGTNKPKIISGTAFAQGGGYIGNRDQTLDKKENIEDPILEKRKKIIASQLQAQKALSTGQGLSIKGASIGRDLGTGYGSKYQGRDAIVIKGGATNMDLSINIGGRQYYGMKRGNDAIYTLVDNRDVGGGGFFQPGGLFGGPRMSSRMDYAQSKGKYYSSSDQKTYANYNDAKSARQSRLTSLASQQRLNRLSSQGAGPRTGMGKRYTAEMKAQMTEDAKRGGDWGKFTRGLSRMFSDPNSKLGGKRLARMDADDKASSARVKQAGAESIGRYYSSSDGKYYKDYNAAVKAKKIRLAQQQNRTIPTIKPPVKPQSKYTPAGGGMGGARGSGYSQGTGTKTPNFSATNPTSSNAKQKTLGITR